MIEETGTVIALDGSHAWVETERRSTCGSCSAKGCGTGVLSKVIGARAQRVRVENRVGARIGDTVVLGLREDALVRGSLAVYIVPLLAMFAGALAGELVLSGPGTSEFWTVLAGLAGLGAGLLWLRAFGRRAADNARYQAVALRVVPHAGVARVAIDKLVKP